MQSSIFKWLISILFVPLCLIGKINAEEVQSYYGVYDTEQKNIGVPAKSLQGPFIESWVRPSKASKPYHIAILVPQLIDTWQAFSTGAMKEANKLGVKADLYSTASYLNFGDQREQLNSMTSDRFNGVILGSISYSKMDQTVEKVTNQGIPVVAMGNDVLAKTISAKSLVSFYDMGYMIGKYVINDAKGKIVNVAMFPGPKGAGWSVDSLKGFKAAINENQTDNNIHIVNEGVLMWGDTREIMQNRLLNLVLNKHKGISYVIGNAVAANLAANLVGENNVNHPKLKVLSTYINPAVYDSILNNKITAAACDFPVRQGEYAVDLLLRILEGAKPGEGKTPFRVGPVIEMVTHKNIAMYSFESIFGQKNFKLNLSN